MGDVFVLKTADDVDDRIHFRMWARNLFPALPRWRPSPGPRCRQTGRWWGRPLGLKHLGQAVQPFVGRRPPPPHWDRSCRRDSWPIRSCAGDRINRVDLPTLGKPTIPVISGISVHSLCMKRKFAEILIHYSGSGSPCLMQKRTRQGKVPSGTLQRDPGREFSSPFDSAGIRTRFIRFSKRDRGRSTL